MNKDFQNIDVLITKHMDRELSTVDWDRLYEGIQQRLDDVENQDNKTSARKVMLRWGIALTSAAAIVLAVFMLAHDSEQPLPLPPGQQVAVKLSEPDSVVKIEIENPIASVSIKLPAGQTGVQTVTLNAQIVRCDVTIIDQNGHAETQNSPRPSWIIIAASKSEHIQTQTDKDQVDIACLL